MTRQSTTSVAIAGAAGEKPTVLSFEEFSRLVPVGTRFKRRRAKSTEVQAAVLTAHYGRYSSQEQKPVSLDRQFDNCASMGARSGDSDHRFTFSDPEATGMNMKRAGLTALMKAASEKRFARLIVEDVDRLSRVLRNLLYIFEFLQHHKIELWDAKHGKLDFVHVVIFGFMAQQGRERMLDTMKGGKLKAIERHEIPGAPRLGYKRDPYRDGHHVVDPYWEERVLEIFRLVADGVTTYQVAKDFNHRYPTGRPVMRKFKKADPNRPAWTPIFIQGVIRNYLYIGFFIWGDKQQVKDFDTNKVTGHIDRDPNDLLIVVVPHLAFVPSDLWARANRRLDEREGEPRGCRPRGLLHGIIGCSCGSGLTESGKPPRRAYRCINNRGLNPVRCANGGLLPVAAVQAAVITAFGDEVASKRGAESTFRRHMEAEMRADQARCDQERQRVIDRLAAISAEHDDTWNKRYTENRPPEWLANRRLILNREELGLRSDLGRLNSMGSVDDFFSQVRTIGAGMRNMIGRLPFEATTAAEAALREGLRSFIEKVVVSKPVDGIASAEMTIRANSRPAFEASGEAQLMLPFGDGAGARGFVLPFAIDCLAPARDRKVEKADALEKERHRIAQSRRFDLPQAAMREIRRALKDVSPDKAEPEKETKRLMDGLMFAFKAPCPFDKLPTRYGDPEDFYLALQRFGRNGRLAKAVDVLVSSYPHLIDGLDTRRLAASALKRSASQIAAEKGRTRDAFDERDGLGLLEAADRETDPMVKSRKRSVGHLLCGMTLEQAAAREGVSKGEVSRRLAAYRADPEHGLDRGEDQRHARAQLTDAHFNEIEKIFDEGVDPRDPDKRKPLDWDGIMWFCLKIRPGLTYNQNYVSRLLRDRKISLAASLAAARERKPPPKPHRRPPFDPSAPTA